MTENKQFVYYEHKGADYILENPNEDLDFIEMLGDCLDSEEIVNRLNKLSDEVEQLKNELARQQLINISMKTEKGIDKLQSKIKELIDENEVLKSINMEYEDALGRLEKENERIKHIIQEAYETERTAIGKSVLKQLMEAIQ